MSVVKGLKHLLDISLAEGDLEGCFFWYAAEGKKKTDSRGYFEVRRDPEDKETWKALCDELGVREFRSQRIGNGIVELFGRKVFPTPWLQRPYQFCVSREHYGTCGVYTYRVPPAGCLLRSPYIS